MSEKKRLLISFSGGRTSAYMLWWLFNVWKDRNNFEIIIVFANTGKEDEGTYKFVHDCSVHWNIPIVWVEGYPNTEKGWGVSAKVVTYETASRNGEPFEAMIAKLGIPTTNAPFCSDQLKRKAINAYLKDIGFRGFYKAIGIRNDEIDRVNPNWRKLRIMYPLITLCPTTKPIIRLWWIGQDFGLDIDDDLGNCDFCWKKDHERLQRAGNNHPEKFKWWQDMTDKYGHLAIRPAQKKMQPPFNFYRGNISPNDIMAGRIPKNIPKSKTNCSESCEPF